MHRCLGRLFPLLSISLFLQAQGIIHRVAGYGPVTDPDGLAATAAFLSPITAITVSPSGVVVFAHLTEVVEISPDGTLRRIAGGPLAGFAGDGGPARDALLNHVTGLAFDRNDNLYISDSWNQRVRKVTEAGTITTVAGGGAVQLLDPEGVAVDAQGNLLIADTGLGVIRKMAPDGSITTLPPTGVIPTAISVDASGNLLVAGYTSTNPNNKRYSVRKILANSNSTVEIPPAPDPIFGVALDASGNSFVAMGTVTRIAPDGSASPVAAGVVLNALGVALDAAGNVFIAESHWIRRVDAGGVITTVAGVNRAGSPGDEGRATAATLDQPVGVAVDLARNIYIADKMDGVVRKVTRDGVIHTAANIPGVEFITVDRPGNLYVSDPRNHSLIRFTPDGSRTTIADAGSLVAPRALTVDDDENVFVVDYGRASVRKVAPGGGVTTVGEGVLDSPCGVATDGSNLYVLVACAGAPGVHVQKVAKDGTISALVPAMYSIPPYNYIGAWSHIAADRRGNVYLSNYATIDRVSPDGTIRSVVGHLCPFDDGSGDGGPAEGACLALPDGIAIDGPGDLYIAQSRRLRVRKVNFPPAEPKRK